MKKLLIEIILKVLIILLVIWITAMTVLSIAVIIFIANHWQVLF